MTRMPRCRLSATFSAAWRQTLQDRKSDSPSFHSLVVRSMYRGVDATRNVATAWPVGVYRSSGSLTRLPMIVIVVSPAAIGGLPLDRFGVELELVVPAAVPRPRGRSVSARRAG